MALTMVSTVLFLKHFTKWFYSGLYMAFTWPLHAPEWFYSGLYMAFYRGSAKFDKEAPS